MQLPDSFKYQLAIGRLFAKYRDKQLENVNDILKKAAVHKVHKSGHFTVLYLKSLSIFERQKGERFYFIDPLKF